MARVLSLDGQRVTTDADLAADLRASLQARGVAIGLTVGDFIDGLRQLGVQDSTPLLSIEVGISAWGNGRMVIDGSLADGIEVKELSQGGTK